MPPPPSGIIAASAAACTPGEPRTRSNSSRAKTGPLSRRVAGEGEIERRQLHAARIESRIDRRRPFQRAHEQRGGDDEHDAERDLRDDERVAQPHALRSALGVRFQLAHHVRSRRMQRGREPESHGGDERQAQREHDGAQVERQGMSIGTGKAGKLRQQERGHHAREHKTHRAAQEEQQRRLDEHLPHEPAASGADREPHRDFAAARVARASSTPATFAHAIASTSIDDAHQNRDECRDRPAVAGNRRLGDDAQPLAAILLREIRVRAAPDLASSSCA